MAKNKNITAAEMAELIKSGDRTYSAVDAYTMLQNLQNSRVNGSQKAEAAQDAAPADAQPQSGIESILQPGAAAPVENAAQNSNCCSAAKFPSLTNTLLILIAFFLFMLVVKN